MNKLESWKETNINAKMLNSNIKLYIGDNLKVMKKIGYWRGELWFYIFWSSV